MFGRQIFLDSMDNQHQQRRRNEFLRQYVANQGHGTPFTELAIPSLRNDGLTLDLNFIVVEDADRVQPNDVYFRTNACNRHLLEYIRQMEERYVAMERELTRTKMLIPGIARNTRAVHRMSQTDVNWEQCSLAKKYGRLFGSSSGNQCRKNHERTNVSSRRKNHTMKRNKGSNGKTLGDIDWTKYRNSSQNLQNDIYPIKDSSNHTCRPKTLINNSNAICSMHNVAVILPQHSTQLEDLPRYDRTNAKENSDIHKAADKCDPAKIIFANSKKCFNSFEPQKVLTSNDKISMEVCQGFGKKREPETSYSDFNVKQQDHTGTGSIANTLKFRPIMERKVSNDISERKSEVEQSTCHQRSNDYFEEKSAFKKMKTFENTDLHRKENPHVGQTFQNNRNHWNNHSKRLPYERMRPANDPTRNFTRLIQKQKKETHKRVPTPRSNVHTAYTPMVQPFTWTPMLDTNGLTIQLLRLAVLLYAPGLMPALNSLIARQNAQTSIPIPCSEGSNDLLTQVFTILSSQQNVPNLPYAPNPRTDENSQVRGESNSQNSAVNAESHSEHVAGQLRDESCGTRSSTSDRFENNSIAVNTSLEVCTCTDTKSSSPRCSDVAISRVQAEEDKIVYA